MPGSRAPLAQARVGRELGAAPRQRAAQRRAEQGRQVAWVRPERLAGVDDRRVEVDLDGAGAGVADDVDDVALGHAPGLHQAVDALGRTEPCLADAPARTATEQPEDHRPGELGRQQPAVVGERPTKLVAGEPHRARAMAAGERQHAGEHHRVQVHVQVAVDVRQRQAGGGEARELGGHLTAELLARGGAGGEHHSLDQRARP